MCLVDDAWPFDYSSPTKDTNAILMMAFGDWWMVFIMGPICFLQSKWQTALYAF